MADNQDKQSKVSAIKNKNCEEQEHLLDARGLLCPEPVMLLHKKIRVIATGEVIKMLATDPSSERDVTRFCEFLRHPLVALEKEGDTCTYWIKKRAIDD